MGSKPYQGRPDRKEDAKMFLSGTKTPFLHTNGERGFVFCGQRNAYGKRDDV
jgi:hypothetical protein